MSETIDAPQTEAAPAPEPEASPADDLRAALSAAYDEVAAADETPPVTPQADRDEQGRFVSREAPEAPTEAVAEPEAPPEPVAAIPPDLAPLKAVLDENRQLYEARGLPPAEAVRALFGAQKALQERPYEAIQQLARDFGVDLSRFGQAAPQVDPNDPNAGILARLEAMERAHITQQQQAEQATQAELHGTIARFAADPKHTHFPAVRSMMGALMTSGAANDLPTAYEMACRAHPEVYKAIQKAEQEARTKVGAAAAAQAKAKAVSVRGSPPVNGFTKPPESLRDTLEAAWEGRLN